MIYGKKKLTEKKTVQATYKLKTRKRWTRTSSVQAHSAAKWPPRPRKALKKSTSVQAPYKTQDIYMVILGKMSSGKMFYAKKDGAKYFILGKMSSGRQKQSV